MKRICSILFIIAGLTSCKYTSSPSDGHQVATSTTVAGATSNTLKSPEQIKDQLHTQLPDLPKIDVVKDSPISNLYEVEVGRQVFYVTKDGSKLIFGSIINPENGQNLTQQAKDKLNTIDWNKLPLNLAIKQVNGTGKDHKIAVFTDPECPYCQQFEQKIADSLPNTTIYNFLFPLKELHPHAEQYTKNIWCSKDRLATFSDWMRNHKGIDRSVTLSCDFSGLKQIESIGKDLVQVSGTPTFILENGQIIVGLLPREQLIDAIDKSTKDVK